MSTKLGYLVCWVLLLALFSTPWLPFGRTPAPLAAPITHLTLRAIGDVTFGRYVGAEAEKRGDYSFLLDGIATEMRGADLGLANLEGPLVENPPPYVPATQEEADKLALIGDTQAARVLAEAGLKVMSLANNHILDAGLDGVFSTIKALRDAGVTPVGAGANEAEARQPARLTIDGTRIAVLARSAVQSNYILLHGGPLYPGPAYINTNNPASLHDLESDIAAARKSADIVLLVMHWGEEYTVRANEAQRAIAEAAARAGVDLVIGAHPHVAQPLELLTGPAGDSAGTPVAYSLGNAVFDQFWTPEVREGLMLAATFDSTGLAEAQLLPLQRSDYSPQLAAVDDPTAIAAIRRIYEQSSPKVRQLVLSKPVRKESRESYELLPALLYAPRLAPDSKVATDLRGDGTTEEVSLQDERLIVRRREPDGGRARLQWVSPPDWRIERFRVVAADELAANGREIAFTVWKPSLATEYIPPSLRGRTGQHFFLFGERDGGIYPVWNSSILPDPLLDFDFAPGPPPRLVTLEGAYDDQSGTARAVAVWGWTGFGYTLEWRSPPLSDGKWKHVEWRGATYIVSR